jgi:hypothetical protein
MSVRPFDWRDLSALHRYRKQSVFLNSALVLTRGPMLFSGALLSFITPAAGIYTSVSTKNDGENRVLIGQIIHYPLSSQTAQLTFLAPADVVDEADLHALMEHLSTQTVERGALRLLADVDEGSSAFEALRNASFAIYARQQVWQVTKQGTDNSLSNCWKPAAERDLIPVRSLYYNLVPGLVQQVEPFPAERLNGLVYRQGDDVLAYVELKQGHRGIWAQPFVHPDAGELADRLVELLLNLPDRRSRPVYVCVRSYQGWLESAVEETGALVYPRQAVMVKHMAVPQKAVRGFALPVLEGGHPEVSAPIANSGIVRSQNTHSEK